MQLQTGAMQLRRCMVVDVLIITFIINKQSTGLANQSVSRIFIYEPVRHYFQIEFARWGKQQRSAGLHVMEGRLAKSQVVLLLWSLEHTYIVEWSGVFELGNPQSK